MEKSVNRKGEVTISTVIFIVLGLAVLVFLIIGLTQGWDIFFGNIGKVDPGDLQVFAKACIGYAEASLSISFCDFKKVDTGGDDEYVNCRDGRILPLVTEEYSGTPSDCGGGGVAEAKFCRESGKISVNKFSTIKVNGQSCAGRGVSGLCTGTATACSGLNESQCGASTDAGQLGCEWGDRCTGTATACNTITEEAKCGASTGAWQLGCEWKVPS